MIVAARGIHVEDIDTVINFDIPREPETYVHRLRRTGRVGASGTAYSLCGADEREQLASIERLTGRKFRPLETPGLMKALGASGSAASPERGGARRRAGDSRRRRSRGRSRRSTGGVVSLPSV